MKKNDQPVGSLRNVGPTIARRLQAIGIRTRGQLERTGAPKVFRRMRERHPDETLSVCYYLYSLEGALRDVHWDALGASVKSRLRHAAGVD